MKKAFQMLSKYFEPVLIVAAISTMILLIVLQIILRLFDLSLSQAEEISRFLFVWSMYLAISYAIRDERHIRLVFVIDKLPQSVRDIVLNLADLVFLAFSVVVVFFGYRVVERSLELGQVAAATEWPIAVIYSSVLVGGVLNIIRLISKLVSRTVRG